MNVAQRRLIIRWATIVLTLGAFMNSYRHGVQWAQAHSPDGQAEFWTWAIAALPEVMVLIGVMLALNRLSDPRAWVIGGTGVAWTLWANGASASGGASGMFVALAPAWAALMALWAMDHAKDEPAGVDQGQPVQEGSMDQGPAAQMNPGPRVQEGSTDRAQGVQPGRSRGPRTAPKGSSRGVQGSRPRGPRGGSPSKLDRVQLWAMDQPEWPTTGDILKAFPDVSRSTAKRVSRPAGPVDHDGTDGTADRGSGELSLSR